MEYGYFHLAITVASVAFVLVAMMSLRQHRTPQSAFAWLLFTALLPYVGVPAFLALGNRKALPQPRLLDFPDRTPLADLPPMAGAIGRLAAHGRLPPARGGNETRLLLTGEAAWSELVSLIDGARDSLDLAFYKWANDPVALELAGRLADKAAAGVRVRLLLDGYGARWRPRPALAAIEEKGGEVRIFAPLVDNPIRGHVNLRNHRKIAIGDRKTVFGGGMNIGEEYLGPPADGERWMDLGYVLRGPVVADHSHIFEADWQRAGNAFTPLPDCHRLEPAGDSLAQFMPSGPDIEEDVLHDILVMACYRSKERIVVVTPYFLPSPVLSSAFSVAARRGVEVCIIVPARSNQRVADLARTSFFKEMADCGARVLLSPAMIHAKAMIFDDFAAVGSANLDIRSLFINFESMLLLYGDDELRQLRQWAEALERRCEPWAASEGLAGRVTAAVFRLGAPLM